MNFEKFCIAKLTITREVISDEIRNNFQVRYIRIS